MTHRAIPTTSVFLLANSDAYERLAKRTQDDGACAETILSRVVDAAQFAALFHPGRFADGMIENAALQVGAGLHALPAEGAVPAMASGRPKAGRRVLHVASHVLGVGGHTRMLCHWIRNDRESCHSLVAINQRDLPIPPWLSDAIEHSGGSLTRMSERSSLCDRAKDLRKLARTNADLVLLHHGPFDVVPTAAFAVRGGPPVVTVNHADHQFWLGSSVSDMVISLRTAGAEHTARRRFISSNTVLPVPLADPIAGMSRREARKALGIPEAQVVLLSIGRAEKYRPCGPYDFVRTAGTILQHQPSAHLYVVGESVEGIAPHLRCALHERLHFVGSMEDPSSYRSAADIYLESFPFGSQTALLEAVLAGLPVVPAYAPLFALLVANDDAVRDLLPNPPDEHAYVEQAEALVREPRRRVELGQLLRSRILFDHVGEGWLARLADVYEQTDRLSHDPRPIPTARCSDGDADVGLSYWNIVADGRTGGRDSLKNGAIAALRHTAFVAKEAGDYAKARYFAWRAVRDDPYGRASWRLLAVVLLGKVGKIIRARSAQG